MRAYLALAIIISTLGGTAIAAEPVRLRADAWCPYNCEPKAEKPGYMVEIMQRIFADEGGLDYQLLPWTRAVEEARAARIDAVAGATVADADGLVFGRESAGITTNVIIVRRGDKLRYTDPRSLEGKRLAAVLDYSYGEALDDYIKAHAGDSSRLELAAGEDVTDQNLKKLLAGRVDAVVEDMNVAEFALAAQGMDGLVEMQAIDGGTPLYVAFAPGPDSAARAAKLDAGIQRLRKSGDLSRILARYGLGDWAPVMANVR
ncbi:ABC transporter substrate-binding protein [Niveispirillum sp.]|uniref:substrate-binding periplasmic protein n=1 Tax=Niveispirillum sp. TaxID=1917217 RepID=UPI001B5AEF90|nr:transporter substrate-binding domain-containing protein [Niveispirillum sp.]MBP7340030.1 transporter substrate-binding domain-containing protein [Niveispirillum sp.]